MWPLIHLAKAKPLSRSHCDWDCIHTGECRFAFPSLAKTQAVRYYSGMVRKISPELKALYSELGRVGGSVSTKAKSDAARLNGKKGGRPRKKK